MSDNTLPLSIEEMYLLVSVANPGPGGPTDGRDPELAKTGAVSLLKRGLAESRDGTVMVAGGLVETIKRLVNPEIRVTVTRSNPQKIGVMELAVDSDQGSLRVVLPGGISRVGDFPKTDLIPLAISSSDVSDCVSPEDGSTLTDKIKVGELLKDPPPPDAETFEFGGKAFSEVMVVDVAFLNEGFVRRSTWVKSPDGELWRAGQDEEELTLEGSDPKEFAGWVASALQAPAA